MSIESYEEWEEFHDEMWFFNVENLELDVNCVIEHRPTDGSRNSKNRKKKEEHNTHDILDVIRDWVVFLKDDYGITIKPMKLNRSLYETKQMEGFINQVSEDQISPDGPDKRSVRGENHIKWFHNSLFIMYLDHYLLSTSYQDTCEPPIGKIEKFLRFCYSKYLSQSDFWMDGLENKIANLLSNKLSTVEICENIAKLFDIEAKPKSEAICGYCGFVQFSEQKNNCNACGLKTNLKMVRYGNSNFTNSFKKFDKIPRLRIKNILKRINVYEEFYIANAEFIQKMILELPQIEANEERDRLNKIKQAEELRALKEQERLNQIEKNIRAHNERQRAKEEKQRKLEEDERIWNLPENVEKRNIAKIEKNQIEQKLRSEREVNLRTHGLMLTNIELERHLEIIEENKQQKQKLIKTILKHRNKNSPYSDRFDWSDHYDNIPLLNELCGDNYRLQFLKSVVYNHAKYQYGRGKLVSSYRKMLNRIQGNCRDKDEFHLISEL